MLKIILIALAVIVVVLLVVVALQPAGPGASYSWTGNNEVGEGRLTITENRPSDMVQCRQI